jgi:TPR repeat protein
MWIWILCLFLGNAWAADSSDLISEIKQALESSENTEGLNLEDFSDSTKQDRAMQKAISFLNQKPENIPLIVKVYEYLLTTSLKTEIETEIAQSPSPEIKALITEIPRKKMDPAIDPQVFEKTDLLTEDELNALNALKTFEAQAEWFIEKINKSELPQAKNLFELLTKTIDDQKKTLTEATQTKLNLTKNKWASPPLTLPPLNFSAPKNVVTTAPQVFEKTDLLTEDELNALNALKTFEAQAEWFIEKIKDLLTAHKDPSLTAEKRLQAAAEPLYIYFENNRKKRTLSPKTQKEWSEIGESFKNQSIQALSAPASPLRNRLLAKGKNLQIDRKSPLEFDGDVPGLTPEEITALNELTLDQQIELCFNILKKTKEKTELSQFLIDNLKDKELSATIQERFDLLKAQLYEAKGNLIDAKKLYKIPDDIHRIEQKQALLERKNKQGTKSLLTEEEKNNLYSALTPESIALHKKEWVYAREKKAEFDDAGLIDSNQEDKNRLVFKKSISPLLTPAEQAEILPIFETEPLYTAFQKLSLLNNRLKNPKWLFPLFRFFRNIVKNEEQALVWGRKAADLGDQEAIKRLSDLQDYFDIPFLKQNIPHTFDHETVLFEKSWDQNMTAVLNQVSDLGIGEQKKEVKKALKIIHALEWMIKESRKKFPDLFLMPPAIEKRLFLYMAELLEKTAKNGEDLEAILHIYKKIYQNQQITDEELQKHQFRLQVRTSPLFTSEYQKKMTNDLSHENFIAILMSLLEKILAESNKNLKENPEKIQTTLYLFEKAEKIFPQEVLWLQNNPSEQKKTKPVYIYYIKGRFLELEEKNKEAKELYAKAQEQGSELAKTALKNMEQSKSKSAGSKSFSSDNGGGSSWRGSSGGSGGGYRGGSGGELSRRSSSANSGKKKSINKKMPQKPKPPQKQSTKKTSNQKSPNQIKSLFYPLSFSPMLSQILDKVRSRDENSVWKLPQQSFEKPEIGAMKWKPVYLLTYYKPLWENKCIHAFAEMNSLSMESC